MKISKFAPIIVFVATLLAVPSVIANPAKVHVNDLFGLLTRDKAEKTLTGHDFKRHPKLAEIVVGSDQNATITQVKLIERIGAHVEAYKQTFTVMDIDNDGRISPVEMARRAP